MSKDNRTIQKGLGRTRNFATIVYPESAPENWLDIIADLKIEVFISPLHDKDLNPTGEQKKPHYHVIIMFPSVKTEEQAKEVFDTFCGVGCGIGGSCLTSSNLSNLNFSSYFGKGIS